mmetsp:Transcript_63044/g.150393  ORF Transcript_63044/g.150393 Transcript_63044/m.150393 type:complete len:231 (+) Transcript_63044:91-783(+)
MLAVGTNEKLAYRLASGQDLAARFRNFRIVEEEGGEQQFDQYGRTMPFGRTPSANNQLNSQLYASYSSTAGGYTAPYSAAPSNFYSSSAAYRNPYSPMMGSSAAPIRAPRGAATGGWTVQIPKAGGPPSRGSSPPDAGPSFSNQFSNQAGNSGASWARPGQTRPGGGMGGARIAAVRGSSVSTASISSHTNLDRPPVDTRPPPSLPGSPSTRRTRSPGRDVAHQEVGYLC